MDTSITALGFWSACAALLYAYIGYPSLLAVITPRRRRANLQAPAPSVSVIVAAYNEKKCIADKIVNLMQQDYPSDLLEIIVVSDGSTDETATIVRAYSPRVRLLAQPSRGGKNTALNVGVRVAKGEILVFTDANALLAPESLRRLVAPFVDSSIGLVSGCGHYGRGGGKTSGAVSNAYVRYEQFTKVRESGLGFLAAADGALYAIRRECYRQLAPNDVHDLVHPIQVALAGRDCMFEPAAATFEPPSTGSREEFRRHVRIIAQGFAAMRTHGPTLARDGRVRELWMLASHRLLRWVSLFFLLVMLVSNVMLAHSHALYAVALVGQVAFYCLAIAGALAEASGLQLRMVAVPFYFCLISVAGLCGFIQFLRGHGHAVWTPTGGGRSKNGAGGAGGRSEQLSLDAADKGP